MTSPEKRSRSAGIDPYFFFVDSTVRTITGGPPQVSRIVAPAGSDQALQPDAGLGPYAQAKAATHSFAKMLARELAADGIRVNVVAPGMIRTPLFEVLMEQRAREFGTDLKSAEQGELAQRGVPLARLGEPEEVAQAVLYLATASFCTGTILNISGGNVRAVMC